MREAKNHFIGGSVEETATLNSPAKSANDVRMANDAIRKVVDAATCAPVGQADSKLPSDSANEGGA